MGSAEECALGGTLLYMRVRLRVCWKDVLPNVLPPFMDGNALGSVPENAGCQTRFPCVLKHARDTGHVSTVQVYCVPVYYPTYLGGKVLKRRSYEYTWYEYE